MKHIAEQVRDWHYTQASYYTGSDREAAAKHIRFAEATTALLRERESAKAPLCPCGGDAEKCPGMCQEAMAVVTEVQKLERWGKAPAGSKYLLQPMDDGYWTPWHIAQQALESVASTLAIGPYETLLGELLAVIHQDDGNYARTHGVFKATADAMEKVDKMLASARVPDAEVTALKNLAYDMRQQAGNNNRLTHIGWAQRVERVVTMLATAPKPETEE